MNHRPTIDLYELEGRIDCDDERARGGTARCYVSPEITPTELMVLVTLARKELARRFNGTARIEEHIIIDSRKEKP